MVKTQPSVAKTALLRCIGFLGVFALAATITFAYLVARGGSIRNVPAVLRGESIVVKNPVLYFAGSSGSEQAVTLENISTSPVQILGFNADCSCTAVKGLPITLAAGGTSQIIVVAQRQNSSRASVTLMTEAKGQPFIKLSVRFQ